MSAEIKRQLTKMAEGVQAFHDKVVDPPIMDCCRLPEGRRQFRIKFMEEELEEFRKAEKFSDEIDAIIDLIYVAIGTLLEMGVNPIQMFEPVQEANMQKLRGMTKRGDTYDAIKLEGWQPPDHDKLIEELKLRYAVSPALLEATRIRLERAAKYNTGSVALRDHFPLGAHSIFQMMHTKHVRLQADISSGNSIDRDHPRDLINYADFMMRFLDGVL